MERIAGFSTRIMKVCATTAEPEALAPHIYGPYRLLTSSSVIPVTARYLGKPDTVSMAEKRIRDPQLEELLESARKAVRRSEELIQESQKLVRESRELMDLGSLRRP
jgi:hypothetical protein